jgi:hypothetical protein
MGFIGFFVKLMYVQPFFLLESFHCRNPRKPMLVRKGGFPGTFSENEHAAVFGLSVQQIAIFWTVCPTDSGGVALDSRGHGRVVYARVGVDLHLRPCC